MKKVFNNSQMIISLCLLFSFLIDIMTNLTINLSFSVGMIIRGLLFIYLFFYIIVKYPNKRNLIIIITTIIFSFLYLIFRHNINSIYNIFKFDYIIIILLAIYNLYTKENKTIGTNILNITLLSYSLILIIARITNTAVDSYAVAKVGTIGWFNSANEISAIISIIVSYLFINIKDKKDYHYIITIILALIASFIIGTRTPIIVFIICIVYLLISKLIKDIKNKSIKYKYLIITILLLLIGVIIMPYTPLYKNMIIHINYLGLKSPLEIFTNFKTFDHFIFNRRLTFLLDINETMLKQPTITILFGMKYIVKTVEMDLFDILYRYGVIGLLVFLILTIYILIKLKNQKNTNYLPIIIVSIVSLFSGHVLLSPNVVLIALVVISNTIYKNNKKRILIASYNLEVGGIEKALINFIKNIKTSNNEITLYLEEKKGGFLSSIPKGVIIKEQKVFNLKNKIISKTLNLLNKIKYLIFNHNEYDFSCCYATYSLSSNFLARYASKNNSIYIHSDYTELYKNDVNKINEFFNPRHLNKFKYIIFVSNEAKEHLVKYYPFIVDKSLVINNFIDEEDILNKAKEPIKEKKPQDKTLLVFVGRIDESSKNLTRLVNSIELALKKEKNILLWIIGAGPDEAKIQKLINNKKLNSNIKMLGVKLNPYPYMNIADYIILTSDYEGFPVIYGEALTLQKRIISTIDVSDESISIPNNYGYICNKNEEDIANTIIKLINNDSLKYKKANISKINRNKYNMIQELINK